MNPYQNPNMPKLPDYAASTQGLSTAPKYENVIGAIKRSGNLPQMSEVALPQIQALLAPGGQKSSAYEQAIAANTSQNVSAAQSDALKRGLTGSTIESSNMQGARAAGGQNLAQFYSGTASEMAKHLYNIFQGDINSQRSSLIALAQAMGQEMTSLRDLEQFKMMLQENMAEASRGRKAAMWQSGMQMTGDLAQAGASIYKASDSRLKENVVRHARVDNLDIVSWDWNKEAEAIGLVGSGTGVIADQVELEYPHLVRIKKGFKSVNYYRLPKAVKKAIEDAGGL